MDEKTGLVTGYIVIRKRLTTTLKEYLAQVTDLSPVLIAYLKLQIEERLSHLHKNLNVYQDPSQFLLDPSYLLLDTDTFEI